VFSGLTAIFVSQMINRLTNHILALLLYKAGKKTQTNLLVTIFILSQVKALCRGAYTPPGPWLSAIREKISDKPDEFIKITNSKIS